MVTKRRNGINQHSIIEFDKPGHVVSRAFSGSAVTVFCSDVLVCWLFHIEVFRNIRPVEWHCEHSTVHRSRVLPPRNASLTAMQGSASGSNVRYYPTWKHRPSKNEMNKAISKSKLPDVCSEAMNYYYVFLSLTNMKSSVHLHGLYSSALH
jgi:hypothetical protein